MLKQILLLSFILVIFTKQSWVDDAPATIAAFKLSCISDFFASPSSFLDFERFVSKQAVVAEFVLYGDVRKLWPKMRSDAA